MTSIEARRAVQDVAKAVLAELGPTICVEYHDSKRIGAYCGDWGRDLFHVTSMGSNLDYWAEEEEV